MKSALIIGLITLLQFVLAVTRNHGVFVYGLDDAYIHLDLADQLWRSSNYGLNPHVFAAPSSSILWPLLLTPFAFTPFFVQVPFLIGLFSAAGSAALLERITTRLGYPRYALWLAIVAALAFNLPALALIGMEHGLHIFLTLAVVLGLLRHVQGEKLSWWFWCAIIYGPLVRYEGVLVSTAALGMLFWLGQRRESVIAFIAMLVPLFCFSAFLMAHGQEALPSSTIVKKLRFGDTESGFWIFWIKSVLTVRTNPSSILLLIGSLLSPLFLWQYRKQARSPQAIVLLGLTCFLLLNLFLGRLSAWETPRYSNYALAFAVPLALWLMGPQPRWYKAPLLLLVAIPGLWSSLWGIQPAISAIYQQQYQLGRLTQDYWHAPIAANDIGLIGFNNPHFVLDLVGLDNHEIRKMRLSGQPDWADKAVRDRGIELIAVYRSWFPDDERKNWTPVGEIFRDTYTAWGDSSVLLLTPYPERAESIRATLRPWAHNLPAGTHYEEYDADHHRDR